MNREILFRGKRIDNGEWVYGGHAKWKDGARLSDVILQTGDGLLKDDMTKWYVDPTTVGQYTGLKDKDGVRIFEGDVCVQKGERFVVVYELDRFKAKYGQDDFGPLFLQLGSRGQAEKIGNIHDNPELVK